ncbi:MAG: type II toxin-antitoxin system death-on-curing family toxin [Trueperaceae bacterium]|nr:type II toxin-antitoxin system death-on-curing family toxin [Trueperaceae bacterium]
MLVAESVLKTPHPVLKQNELLSALHAPVASAGGEDAFPYFFQKVAALTHHLVTSHVFRDGNKRTGFLVLKATLEWNGYYFTTSSETNIIVMSLLGAGYLNVDALRHALLMMCGLDPAANLNL